MSCPRVALMVTATAGCVLGTASIAGLKQDAANRKIMHDYARCVVQTHHKRASDMIMADENNATIIKRYPDLISSDCLGRVAGSVRMSFGGDLYRYALADALVNADFSAHGPSDFSDRLPLAHLVIPDRVAYEVAIAKIKSKSKLTEMKLSFDKAYGINWLSTYGECIVRKDLVNAQLWILTPPDQPEEVSRINALKPAFSNCMFDGTLTFNRVNMRGTVAINYYRLAMATPIARYPESH